VSDHQLWEAAEREAMYARTQALLDRPDGAFNFPHVTVCGDDVHLNRANLLPNALELVVGMNVAHVEAARLVKLDDCPRLAKYNCSPAIWHLAHGTKTDAPRNGVKEWDALDKKEIHTKRHIFVVFEYGGRDRDSFECGCPRGSV
jgi:hypothetical protein